MKAETVQSLKQLQGLMPEIIRQYGKDNNLTHIALANPIIALERIGLKFTETAKTEIEHYVRFGKEGLDKLQHLKENIYKHLGTQTDLNNPEQLSDSLVKISEQASKKQSKESGPIKGNQIKIDDSHRGKLMNALKSEPKQNGKDWQDDLQSYISHHPVFAQIIEYRKMLSDHPRFATSIEMPGIEEKLKHLPLKNVEFTLQKRKKVIA